jgi:hypothetical protein
MLTLCHILHSVSHWPVLVYFINKLIRFEQVVQRQHQQAGRAAKAAAARAGAAHVFASVEAHPKQRVAVNCIVPSFLSVWSTMPSNSQFHVQLPGWTFLLAAVGWCCLTSMQQQAEDGCGINCGLCCCTAGFACLPQAVACCGSSTVPLGQVMHVLAWIACFSCLHCRVSGRLQSFVKSTAHVLHGPRQCSLCACCLRTQLGKLGQW